MEALNHEQRMDQAKAYQEKQERLKEKSEAKPQSKAGRPKKSEKKGAEIWYEQINRKVVKKIKAPSGNVHSIFVGDIKDCQGIEIKEKRIG